MRKILLAVFVILCFSLPMMAQDAGYENFAALGGSFNQYADPSIAGNLLYAQRLGADDSTYNFNFVDIVSKQEDTFKVATSVTFGLAQKMLTFGRAKVYVTTGVGFLAGDENLGYSWTGGGAVAIPLGKGFQFVPNVRFLKSSLTDFQPIFGLMLGWGH